MASANPSVGASGANPEVEHPLPAYSQEEQLQQSIDMCAVRMGLMASKLGAAENLKEVKALRLELDELNMLAHALEASLRLIRRPAEKAEEPTQKTPVALPPAVPGVQPPQQAAPAQPPQAPRVPNLPSQHPTYRKSGSDNYADMKLFLEAAETTFRSIALQEQFYLFKVATMVDRCTSRWIESELLDPLDKTRTLYNWRESRRLLIDEFKHTQSRQEATVKLNNFTWDAKRTIQDNARDFLLLMDDAGVLPGDVQRLDQIHHLMPTGMYSHCAVYRDQQDQMFLEGRRGHRVTIRELCKYAARITPNVQERSLFIGPKPSNPGKPGGGAPNKPPVGNNVTNPKPDSKAKTPQDDKGVVPRRRNITCYGCGQTGHIQPNCPNKARSNDGRISAVAGFNFDSDEERDADDVALERESEALAQEYEADIRCAATRGVVAEYFGDVPDLVDSSDEVRFEVETVKGPKGPMPKLSTPVKKATRSADLKEQRVSSGKRYLVPVTVNDVQVLALADTGSEHTLCDVTWAESVGIQLHPTTRGCRPALANAPRASCLGQCDVSIRTTSAEAPAVMYAVKLCEEAPVLLGNDILPKLGMILSNLPVEFPESRDPADGRKDPRGIMDDLCAKPELDIKASEEETHEWLDELVPLLEAAKNRTGFCNHPSSLVHINTTGYSKPIHTHQYPVPLRQLPILRRKIRDLLALGIIKESPDDNPWNFPWVTAPKKNEKGEPVDLRFCVDYRKLNMILAAYNQHEIPHIRRDILSHLGGHEWYSKIDLKDGFHQMRIVDEDQIKTAFTFEGVKYVYVGAPFGLKHLPSHFQMVMDMVLRGLDNVKVYIDDIIIFTKGSLAEHTRVVKQVLARLERYNIRTRMDKCAFFYKQIQILGHIVDSEGIKVDPSKIDAALKWPRPRTNKDIQAFMGLVNYFGEHLPGLAAVARPLNEQRNNKKFRSSKDWSPALESSFCQLKELVQNALKLYYPVEGFEFTLAVDASKYAVGGVLFQDVVEDRRYITVFSKTLSKTEQRYPTMRRELLALLYGLRKCKYYLWGRHFQVLTDHKSLIYMLTQKKMNETLLNWYEEIMSYDMTICHTPGVANVLPDVLSRIYASSADDNNAKEELVPPIRLAAIIADVEDENRRSELMELAHLQGHFGAKAIERHIRYTQQCTWKNIRKDCEELVSKCQACRKYNVHKTGYHPAKSIEASLPMEAVAIDCASLDCASRGNVIILIVVDIFTHFVWLRSLPDKCMETIGRTLLEIFSGWGIPKIVISDQGREFINQIIEAFLEASHIDHRIATAYHPQGNSKAERTVKTTLLTIKKMLRGCDSDWDLYVAQTQLWFNLHISETTQSSPFALMYNRPFAEFKDHRGISWHDMTREERDARFNELYDIVYPAIRGRKSAVHEQRRRNLDKNRKQITSPFPEGALVMVRDVRRSRKTEPPYLGPFTVVRVSRGGAYTLKRPDGSLYERDVAPNHLKLIESSYVDEDGGEHYEVEAIVDHRGEGSSREYLVKWRGYDSSENTWEPPENFDDEISIRKYHSRLGESGGG